MLARPVSLVALVVAAVACIAPDFQGDDESPAPSGGIGGAAPGGGAGAAQVGGGGAAQGGKGGAAQGGSGGSAQAGAPQAGQGGSAQAGQAGAAQAGQAGAGQAGHPGFVAMGAGRRHTCGVSASGEVWCWGANELSQVGDDLGERCDVELGPSGPEPVACVRSPRARTDLIGATRVVGGDGHTCARASDGVRCWGDDSSGQLGDGVAGGARGDSKLVAGLVDVVAVGAGALSTCALDAAGEVWCWGAGSSGQLGDGQKKPSSKPVKVLLSAAATAIAVGGYHACALRADGTISCWGLNLYGELGDGSKEDSASPRDVVGVSGATAIAAGGWHSCALVAGEVLCWGSNTEGQVGSGATGTLMGTATPTKVPGLSGVDSVAAGRERTCAVHSGLVSCWGSNARGELGIGAASSGTTTVSAVLSLSGVASLALGGEHGCALALAGARSCWGWNALGELGDGSTVDKTAP